MIATLRDNQFIYLSHLSQPEENAVNEHFSLKLDNHFVDPSQRGGWNGVYRRYDSSKQRLPRPYLAELRSLCATKGLPLTIKDARPPWKYHVTDPSTIGKDFLPGITLEDYQLDAIRAGCKIESCIISVTTGGGKTEIMAGLCKAMKCPTVILADQRVVIEQIKARLELRDMADVGLFYAGATPTGQIIVVGSVQSTVIPKAPKKPDPQKYKVPTKGITRIKQEEGAPLAATPKGDRKDGLYWHLPIPDDDIPGLFVQPKTDGTGWHGPYADMDKLKAAIDKHYADLLKKALQRYESAVKGYKTRLKRCRQFQEIIGKAEMIIVDECDLAGSMPYRNIFRYWYKGRRRYGFSGTPFDPDKPLQNMFVQENLGSVGFKVEREVVEAAGRIVPIEYVMFAIGDYSQHKEGSMLEIAYREKVTENHDFHRLVKAISSTHTSKNEGVFILVERDALGETLEQKIGGSLFINGKTPKRRRNDVLRLFEERQLSVLIGGKILKRGLDLKGGSENIVLTSGGKLASDLRQKLGRGNRLNALGRCRVYDFYFMDNRYLIDHSRKRLRTVVNLGYSTRVIFSDGQQIDGAQFIASRWRVPKPKPPAPKRPVQPELF